MPKYTILLLVLVGMLFLCGSPVQASWGAQAEQLHCDPPIYYGVQHCVDAGGLAHSIIIDLSDPHIRFRTVLPINAKGQECNSVNAVSKDPSSICPYPYPFERIESMLQRHIANGAVAIINTDYFGGDHGLQGLSVRDGKRLPLRRHRRVSWVSAGRPGVASAAASSCWVYWRPSWAGGRQSRQRRRIAACAVGTHWRRKTRRVRRADSGAATSRSPGLARAGDLFVRHR